MKRHESGFDEIEALIYRLFAEKQFALALLALVMVANLASAQFLLLRVTPPPGRAATAPSPSSRVDVWCQAGGLVDGTGHGIPAAVLAEKKVVVHFEGGTNQCVVAATNAGAQDLVIG